MQLQPDWMLFKGAEKIWRLNIRALSSSCGSLQSVCREFLHTSEASKRKLLLESADPQRKSSFSRPGEASLFHLSRRCLLNVPVVWAAAAPSFSFNPGNVDFWFRSSLKPRGEEKPTLAPDTVCVCVCVCVCLMMMMMMVMIVAYHLPRPPLSCDALWKCVKVEPTVTRRWRVAACVQVFLCFHRGLVKLHGCFYLSRDRWQCRLKEKVDENNTLNHLERPDLLGKYRWDQSGERLGG